MQHNDDLCCGHAGAKHGRAAPCTIIAKFAAYGKIECIVYKAHIYI